MTHPEFTEAYEWRGRTIVGSDGDKIGKVEEIYADQEGGQPEWALVNMGGLLGAKHNFVPLASASPAGENVEVPFDKAQVKEAPGVEADGELSEAEERQLFEHYGVPYTDEGSVTAQSGAGAGAGDPEAHAPTGRGPVGNDVSGPETDEAMTRSEEEIAVGTQQRESGRARLRKHELAADALRQARDKGQEQKGQAKQDLQTGKERGQQQADRAQTEVQQRAGQGGGEQSGGGGGAYRSGS